MIEKQPPRPHHHQNGYRKPCLFFHISWVLLGDVTQTGRTFKSYVCTVTSKRGWVTEVDGFSCSGPLLCIYSLLESQDSQYSDLSKCLRRGCSKGSRKSLNSRSLPQGEEIHLSKRSLWPPTSTKEKASMAGVGMCHADCGGWTASGGQLLQGPPQLERVAHPKTRALKGGLYIQWLMMTGTKAQPFQPKTGQLWWAIHTPKPPAVLVKSPRACSAAWLRPPPFHRP